MDKYIKVISPHMKQAILRTLGLAHSTYLGNDLYFYLRAVQMLISDLDENFIADELKKEGKDWIKIKRELKKNERIILKAKSYYDMIEDKTFSKEKKEEENKSQFLKLASQIKIIDNPIFFMYVFLTEKTNLQSQTIPSEAFKILEHTGFRKLEMIKKPEKTGGESSGTETQIPSS